MYYAKSVVCLLQVTDNALTGVKIHNMILRPIEEIKNVPQFVRVLVEHKKGNIQTGWYRNGEVRFDNTDVWRSVKDFTRFALLSDIQKLPKNE